MSFPRSLGSLIRPGRGLGARCRVVPSSCRQHYATKTRAPPLPTVQTCPSPTCACADMPAFPDGLEIDHKAPLNGVITGYSEQVIACTGRDDWTSRIEEEDGGDNLAADLKELFGRGGKLSDPFHHISVLNASFPSSVPPRPEVQTTSAYLLPSFKYVPFLPRVSFASVEALARGYLLPTKLHPMHDGALSPAHRDRLTRKESHQSLLMGVRDVEDVLVLVCGHGGRDARCGVLGPVLREEFETKLEAEGVSVARGPVAVSFGASAPAVEDGGDGSGNDSATPGKTVARVGLISHIGGHKFAGNVIIYLPPGLKTKDGARPHPLAGHGIWYGRVEPKHVEGIIKETIFKGNIIADMFRGGIDQERRILRL